MRFSPSSGLSLLFFLSGATALIYQLLWVRVLYQSFGSTIQSVTTVVAAYMAGLGLGAWLLGRHADRHPRPAVLYGWLEIVIGLFGVASPVVLALVHRLWIGAAGGFELGSGPSIALRFGLAALVLIVPTTLMGGTLPVLTRWFTGGERAVLRPQLAKLYGLNTLGAVMGTALAGFFIVEHLGIRLGLWLTAAVNIGIGGSALWLSGRSDHARGPGDTRGLSRTDLAGQSREISTAQPAAESSPRFRRVALVLLVATAFASLLAEIAWTRVLVMIVGGSSYAFTLVLSVFLLGIGLGSSALLLRRSRHSLNDPVLATGAQAALAQAVVAVGAALLLVLFTVLPVYIVWVFRIPDLVASTRLILLGGAVAIVVLIPSIGMGLTFPLLTDLVAGADQARSADVGRAYALNTAGSIAGAVATGFVLVTTLGSDLTLRAGVAISSLAALTLAFLVARGASDDQRRLRAPVLSAGVLAALGIGAAFATPRWDTRLIDLAPTIYGRNIADSATMEAFLEHRGARQLAFREGRNATVSVWESHAGRTLKVNGKADASDHGDMDTQIMLGLAPAAARPRPTSAFVIGHGSGVTARVLAEVPGMRDVHIAELEPAVLAMDSLFRHVNGNVLRRRGVRVVVDDARSALQLERGRFDIIVSEPSNPWVAGVATLYTPEFFHIVRSRLSDDGVFCQWIQLYQLPLSVVAGIVNNVRAVFPHVEIWFGSPHDLVVLGAAHPLTYDDAWLEDLLDADSALGELALEWLGVTTPRDLFGRFLLGPRGAEELSRRGELVHTDDQPRLEFVAARRFLDAQAPAGILDTIITLRQALDPAPGSPQLLARALGTRRGDPAARNFVDAMRRARPGEGEWTIRAAMIRLAAGDSAFADSALATVLARGTDRYPEATAMAGVLAVRRGDEPRARGMLLAALAAGADSAQVHGALAVLAARGRRWDAVAVEVRAALATARGTFRHPLPRELLADAITPLALEGPPDTALAVLAGVEDALSGWAVLYELLGVAALRAGACDRAAEYFLTLHEFGIWRRDGPMLVQRCRHGAVF